MFLFVFCCLSLWFLQQASKEEESTVVYENESDCIFKCCLKINWINQSACLFFLIVNEEKRGKKNKQVETEWVRLVDSLEQCE